MKQHALRLVGRARDRIIRRAAGTAAADWLASRIRDALQLLAHLGLLAAERLAQSSRDKPAPAPERPDAAPPRVAMMTVRDGSAVHAIAWSDDPASGAREPEDTHVLTAALRAGLASKREVGAACRAAVRVAARGTAARTAVPVLEEALVVPGVDDSLRAAALGALEAISPDVPEARAALRRARAVVRSRLDWEPSESDAALLRMLDAAA